MEDTPTVNKINLTRVRFLEAKSYIRSVDSLCPSFISERKFEVVDLDKDELLELAKEEDLEVYEFSNIGIGSIQVVYHLGGSQLIMTSKL
jgi:hypothetical protein